MCEGCLWLDICIPSIGMMWLENFWGNSEVRPKVLGPGVHYSKGSFEFESLSCWGMFGPCPQNSLLDVQFSLELMLFGKSSIHDIAKDMKTLNNELARVVPVKLALSVGNAKHYDSTTISEVLVLKCFYFLKNPCPCTVPRSYLFLMNFVIG